jgi:predicted permease
VLFGLAPALQAARLDVLPALKEPSGVGRGAARIPLGRTLVVVQMALSLLLLVGAALLLRSLANLRSIDTGFDADRVLLVGIATPSVRDPLPDAQLRSLYGRLLARAEAVPGVRAASLSFFGLFTRETWGNRITVEGRAAGPGELLRTFANAVSPRYFEVMGIPVLEGRSFAQTDDERAARVAVVNQAFARQLFGQADAIGRRVGLGAPAREMMEVVGVVKDAKHVDLREAPAPMLYVPFAQHPRPLRELEVRTAGDPTAVVSVLRRELAGVDPRVPVLGPLSLRERVDASIAGERLIAKLSAGFGALALGLASIGLYGVMAYVVARRTAEIGIRMALGARRADVRRLVLRDTLALVLGGMLIGLPAALAAGRLLSSQLYGLTWRDPFAIMAGLSMLSAAALAAAYLPARRAARVDPLVALRYE